jgi:hypothetical protein
MASLAALSTSEMEHYHYGRVLEGVVAAQDPVPEDRP